MKAICLKVFLFEVLYTFSHSFYLFGAIGGMAAIASERTVIFLTVLNFAAFDGRNKMQDDFLEGMDPANDISD